MPPITDTPCPQLVPGDPGYDEARRVWNGDIDRKPALIAQVTGPADVAAGLAYARANDLDVTVRGGGHSLAGSAVADGAVMIDLSGLRSVRVDPVQRTARVGGGATNADVDAATQAHGLAVPTGTYSDTGIGGLTLGGGFGWLTAKFGLSVDNLLSAEVVLADGRVVRASASSHPDLFWAVRGGGGNFGVVTEFEYRLHLVGPLVDAGMFFWELDRGAEALRTVRDLAPTLPAGTGMMTVGMTAPPAPFVPAEHQGKVGYTLILAGFDGTEAFAALAQRVRGALPPLFELVTPLPYTELQKMLDGNGYRGVHAYEKSVYAEELSDELIDVLVTALPGKASPMTGTPIAYLGGAYTAVGEGATAFGGARRTGYMVGITALCPVAELLPAERAWTRDLWQKLVPYASNAGGYVNFMAEYEQDRVRATYGPAKYERLARIKAAYDPDNVFHHNGNIRPAVG
ncbi:FAD-binding oxidoreductase [Kutzneria buriramensis]|uniref:FAD/FMN-containing dehydrogenase n=1 Tax=Kutzneria buriramensis TaxID=1045776 RepID=A0A3E0I1P4_9PSEU|nr:FAD-binding oxidoreductase [Kutzneria buriramensis]REH52105.1 FAD/FMN-containing dehydrogenase [Kutzneria buriramensis]